MTHPPDDDPIDRQMFWTNVVGLSLAALLLGLFGWLYGADLLSFLAFLMGQGTWPG
jgi:hypothetical protein